MRTPRIIADRGRDGLYHCISNIVGGAFLLGPQERTHLVQLMQDVADFLEIELLNYVVMSNHYHQLLRVPGKIKLTNPELLSKIRNYYGDKSRQARQFQAVLSDGNRSEIKHLRNLYLKRMGRLSEYEKTLKQRFSGWYNRRHKRRGTLWMERFKSVLLEDCIYTRTIISNYIDLNPVRAQMVQDPCEYRFCGYGAAMAGNRRCRKSILAIMGHTQTDDWTTAAANYRIGLMERGHIGVKGKSGTVSRELILATLNNEGHLPLSKLLRLRVRYFSDGLAIGSENFIANTYFRKMHNMSKKKSFLSVPLSNSSGNSLKVLQHLRREVFS